MKGKYWLLLWVYHQSEELMQEQLYLVCNQDENSYSGTNLSVLYDATVSITGAIGKLSR